jgi:hypothetical protein
MFIRARSRFLRMAWESFPDDSLAGSSGTTDIQRGVISDSDCQGPLLHRLEVSVLHQRASPRAAGDWRAALPHAEAGNIAARGELLHVRTERGRRFVRLYRLN